jgi:hypothetical protein
MFVPSGSHVQKQLTETSLILHMLFAFFSFYNIMVFLGRKQGVCRLQEEDGNNIRGALLLLSTAFQTAH